MKIVLTGGGTGGHFYPVIAVAEAIRDISVEEKLLEPELVYVAPERYDAKALSDLDIRFVKILSGKMRRYPSLKNIGSIFELVFGIISAFWKLLAIFPDVVFSKGAYASVPVLFAARFFKIPVIIHESDAAPGRANSWAGKFARRIAVGFPEAAMFFDPTKVAVIGNPIRKELQVPLTRGAHEFLKLAEGVPVIFVLGGSQGARIINETIVEALPKLLKHYQVIHQTGRNNFDEIKKLTDLYLEGSELGDRYKPFPFLNPLALRMAAGAADIIISRAGAGSLFEIAMWGKPSIVVPITDSNADHQRKNAFAYARSGACVVIEEANLSPNLLMSEIDRITNDPELQKRMRAGAEKFQTPNAARTIAREILDLALEHEKR